MNKNLEESLKNLIYTLELTAEDGKLFQKTIIDFDRYNHGIPTLIPFKNFDVVRDVHKIHASFKSDLESTVYSILCKRTTEQRLEIAGKYIELYKTRLIKEMKHHYNARFYILMSGLSVPYYEFLARSIHHAIHFKWLYYILFTLPRKDIEDMKHYFSHKYHESAQSFISKKIKRDDNSIWRYLIKPITDMLNELRDVSNVVSKKDVEFDILQLNLLVTNTLFCSDNRSDKEILSEIFLKRNFEHIKLVIEGFSQKNQTRRMHALLKKISPGNNIYNHIVDYVMNKDFYFARLLNKSFDGISHDCYLLTHVFLLRSEIDLFDIKNQYEACHGKNLTTMILENTAGSYRHALLQILDEED